MFKILAINPGSTSTKMAIYEDNKEVLRKEIKHKDIAQIKTDMLAQVPVRVKHIKEFLAEENYSIDSFDALACRCGGIIPAPARVYHVNKLMRDIQLFAPVGKHASQLGGPICWELAAGRDIPIYTAYPPNVDERDEISKVTGLPELQFPSGGHNLNVRTVSRAIAEKKGIPFEKARFVVAHMGGGISVAAFREGRTADTIRTTQGPMSAERSGNLPTGELIDLCFSGKYTRNELVDKISFNSGLLSYLGTNDCLDIENRAIAGDKECEFYLDAMCYQTAKCIGSLVAAMESRLDAIILTGSMARSEYLTSRISKYVSPMAPIEIVPGEYEMEGMAIAALRVLKGEEEPYEFDLVPPPYKDAEDFYTQKGSEVDNFSVSL